VDDLETQRDGVVARTIGGLLCEVGVGTDNCNCLKPGLLFE